MSQRPDRTDGTGLTEDASAERSPLFIQSLEKGLAVLLAFRAGHRRLTLAEIAQTAGISKSAAQRITHTFEALGFLRKAERGRSWTLTVRTLDLGFGYLAGHPLIEQASPHLLDLNQACGETVNLSEPDGTDVVFIARFPSHHRFFVHMPLGRRLPMFCTAAGRAYLSALPEDEARARLAGAPIERFTPTTETDPERILDLVRAARDDGYAWANQEYYRGDLTIAAPVFGEDGRPVAAINLSCPTSRWTLEAMKAELVPQLIETARAVSGRPRGSDRHHRSAEPLRYATRSPKGRKSS